MNDVFRRVKNGPQEYLRTLRGSVNWRRVRETNEVILNIQQINPRGFLAANLRFFYLLGNETDTAEKFSRGVESCMLNGVCGIS